MKGLHILLTLVLAVLQPLLALHVPVVSNHGHVVSARGESCFPSLGFRPRNPNDGVPNESPSKWWCSLDSERGFLGFTYDTESCQSYDDLLADFTRMRHDYNARYVRLYSWCEDDGTYLNDVIKAAYSVGLGVYATIWFGFDGGDAWKGRRDLLVNVIHNNALSRYVIRSVDVGSEPLFDEVLEPQALADEINHVKSLIRSYGIKVSISEMEYGYSVEGDSQMVLDAEDVVHAHELPFFDTDARSGSEAQPSLLSSTNWFVSKTRNNRKVIFTQTGWPTNENVWKPNSPDAVASVESAQAFAQVLDNSCETFMNITPHGGVGWLWHIWSDSMLDGWGLLDWNGDPKWDFSPRTNC